MQETISKLSRELGLSEETITRTYKAYWQFIRQTISNLPLKESLSEEEFNKLQTNFNIPNLGKLACTYKGWLGTKSRNNKLKEIRNNAKHQGNKANGQLPSNY